MASACGLRKAQHHVLIATMFMARLPLLPPSAAIAHGAISALVMAASMERSVLPSLMKAFLMVLLQKVRWGGGGWPKYSW